MKKHVFLLFILIAFTLLCCSCASPEQASDPWAYQEDNGTWPEFNRKAYLQVLYVYENLRPDETLTDKQLATSPDEQILRLIDAEYKDFEIERITPREDDVQYEDMKQIVLSMVESLHIAGPPKLCYSSLRRNPFNKADAEWTTWLCYEEGYHYRLHINGKDGSFRNWRRYPQGAWTYRSNMLPGAPKEPRKRTDEELISAAGAYAKLALATDESDIIESEAVVTATSPYIKKEVTVILKPYKVYQISIDYDDLSITSVTRK